MSQYLINQAHLVTMLTTLAINVIGIILIVIHANGVWLQTQVLNLPHQIAGIAAVTALGVNVSQFIVSLHGVVYCTAAASSYI